MVSILSLSESMMPYQLDPKEQTSVKFQLKYKIFFQQIPFQNFCKMFAILYRHHWVNLLWPSDTIWQQRSGSTLAQVMACCLTAPSHYLNQCWLIISEIQWHSWLRTISQEIPQPSITRIILKIIYLKISFKSPRGQWVNMPRWPNGST